MYKQCKFSSYLMKIFNLKFLKIGTLKVFTEYVPSNIIYNVC